LLPAANIPILARTFDYKDDYRYSTKEGLVTKHTMGYEIFLSELIGNLYKRSGKMCASNFGYDKTPYWAFL